MSSTRAASDAIFLHCHDDVISGAAAVGGRARRGAGVAPGLSALNNEFLWQLRGNRSALCMEAEYRDSAMSVSERTVCSWRYAGVIIA